jgi:GNAT superfamily N-acetyltransferase
MIKVVTLVQLGPDEWPRLRAIRLRALMDAPEAFSGTFDEASSRTPAEWSTQLLDMPTFVAVKNGVDAGIVRCARDHFRPRTMWLLSMWVAPEERKTGVGGALVDAVIEYARSNGAARLLLDVADANASAIALYRRKGFEPNGEAGTLPPPRQHIREHRLELKLA